ncbi:deoxyhypusine synthase [Candidatus Woesearchaeota archaeon]|nr:deoxyhypusine synthase [Candidatus Woesearchaeota archaeon]
MEIKTTHGEGCHLTIDAFECKENLNSKELVTEFLEELPDLIGMKKISKANVIRYADRNEKESGVTGFIIIAESHIAIHTYPEKRFLSADIFSCKEFDYEKAIEFVKSKFKPDNAEHNLLHRGHAENYDADKHLEKIKGFDLEKIKSAGDIISGMKNIGFQAAHLGQAAEILKKIKDSKAAIFLSFTSNMVSSGLREVFAYLVKHKMVDAIITSVGSVEEDLMKCSKSFLLGDFNVSDIDLHRKGINRIGNIFVPNDRYEMLEDVLVPFLKTMHEKQKHTGNLISPSELIYELGKIVKDENSILYWASKNNIPIFCPAITDGAFGLQLYFFKQSNKDFGIDVTADMKQLGELVLNAEKTAGIILGGGFAKHHLIGVNILRGGLDYAIYVTTAGEGDGSSSGARPKEAKSWSKIKEDANNVCIEGDATIIFPLLALSMKETWNK